MHQAAKRKHFLERLGSSLWVKKDSRSAHGEKKNTFIAVGYVGWKGLQFSGMNFVTNFGM